MRAFLAFLVVVALVAGALLYSAAFIVHQQEQAIVLRFGEPKDPISTPGLKWKLPFVDTVEYFDKRILDLDTADREVMASDQQRLIVDAYARYKITDPLKYYQNIRTEERVSAIVSPIIESEIRGVLVSATLKEIVKDKREALMKRIAENVRKQTEGLGIDIIDVRLKRADLHQDNLKPVFDRMRADRVREATELRAQGEAESNRIKAGADRDRTVLLAEATRASDTLRGEGEAERNRIFAEANNNDPEFFQFYRSMQAYETAIKSGDTRLILSPDSAFFKYFKDPSGIAAPQLPKP
jgi:modulator of FtsH protease HflC